MHGVCDAHKLLVIDGTVDTWRSLCADGKSIEQKQHERAGEQGTTPSKG